MSITELTALITALNGAPEKVAAQSGNASVMVGKYVIVRCRDAGVHAGWLQSHQGREAHLKDGRRLWYWKSAGAAFLSGVARDGIADGSKIGATVETYLTETCEILVCSDQAARSIQEAKPHGKD